MTVRKRKPTLWACSLLGVLVTLIFAAGAAAKGPIALDICGPTGCVTLDDQHNAQLLFSILSDASVDDYVASPPLVPYYELRFDAHLVGSPSAYVPSANVVKSGSNWIRVSPAVSRRLGGLLRGLAPFPPPDLTRSLVGNRAAADPSAYAVIFDPLPPAELPLDADRIEIVLEANRPSPWTTRQTVGYYADTGIIWRDGEWFALPSDLATAVEEDSVVPTVSQPPPEPPRTAEADSGIATVASPPQISDSPPGDAFPWAAVAGSAGGVLVLLLAALVALRGVARRPRARPS